MNKKDYDLNYYKTRCTVFKLLLNNEKDEDVILFLRSLPNVNGYLKGLIRDDMMKKREASKESGDHYFGFEIKKEVGI